MKAAIQFPQGINPPILTVHDPLNPAQTLAIEGVPVLFVPASCAGPLGTPCEVELLYPAPPGQQWVQYTTTSDFPSTQGSSEIVGSFRFTWPGGTCSLLASQTVATWFSSDSDDLYGEDVSDLYTIGNFPAPPPPFVRGDCNPSGAIDLADGLSLLNYLFVLGSPTPPCLAACDVNGDDGADLGDALYLLNFLFVDGAAPPDPYPDCGTLPMMVACDSFAGCP